VKITVQSTIRAPRQKAWDAYITPADIIQWNAASDDWHTPRATVDLREGGQFVSRMEAKDGSFGFDFGGTYTKVVPLQTIAYRMDDAREATVEFADAADGCVVTVTFDAESENSAEMQRGGWQAILDNFAKHVVAKG
jgi:uncharacterized protein YndB with AHSA1/START domain